MKDPEALALLKELLREYNSSARSLYGSTFASSRARVVRAEEESRKEFRKSYLQDRKGREALAKWVEKNFDQEPEELGIDVPTFEESGWQSPFDFEAWMPDDVVDEKVLLNEDEVVELFTLALEEEELEEEED